MRYNEVSNQEYEPKAKLVNKSESAWTVEWGSGDTKGGQFGRYCAFRPRTVLRA